jgi:cytochrome c-type biogenesis protein CcmH/NrfF
MTAVTMSFRCPVCDSVFSLDKRAVRGETFRCPVCHEGEIDSRTAELEADRIARSLLGEPGGWVILPAHLETVSKS